MPFFGPVPFDMKSGPVLDDGTFVVRSSSPLGVTFEGPLVDPLEIGLLVIAMLAPFRSAALLGVRLWFGFR